MGQRVILVGDDQRRLARRLVDVAPPGAVVEISAPKRTQSQNDLMWAILSDVSRAKPGGREYTPETWKCLFMQACGHDVRFVTGLNGEPFPVGFRSSRLTKRQMVDLIDFIYAWGSEQGVRWSMPADMADA